MPINEWDDPTTPIPSLDEMKYELSAKNPINIVKKAIQHMPGADVGQAAVSMGSDILGQVAGVPYGIYQSIMSGKYGTQEGVQQAQEQAGRVAQKFHVTPESQSARDILETAQALPEKINGSHMGFGPLPETWVAGLGSASADDLRVLAKQNIERAREIRNIPTDYANAQSGVLRQSNLGGTTYGAALQAAVDDLAAMQARNQARRNEYATPMSGSVEVFGNLMPDTAMYAVRPNKSSGQVIREVPTPLNPAYSVSGESRLTEDLTNIIDRNEPRTENDRSYQHIDRFTNFIPEGFNQSAKEMFRNFLNPILAEEFPGTDPADFTRAIHAKYGSNANEWYKKQLEAFALLPEVKQHNEMA